MLAAAHGFEDAFPTLVTLHELKHGQLTSEQLKDVKERGGLALLITLTTDAESVYKSLTSRDLKVPTEKTLLGHVKWIRELLQLGLIKHIQWCDTRDMTADGHTKGSIDRQLLLEVMSGTQQYRHDVKRYTPHKQQRTTFYVDTTTTTDNQANTTPTPVPTPTRTDCSPSEWLVCRRDAFPYQ